MLFVLTFIHITVYADAGQISDDTQECLDCHAIYHPGIVQDWKKSRHAVTTPKTAGKAKALSRRISSERIPGNLKNNIVGCAECHSLKARDHADTFEHNGHEIHVVVSPNDCAVCHSVEQEQFSMNIMSMAEKNLTENSLYQDLQKNILGTARLGKNHLEFMPADDLNRADACYHCHGTRLQVKGFKERETDVGELTFPIIDGWPNQGVGRVNTDGSRGTCSACHSRHQFSIETARKPYTCKQCHSGPDVPAFKVYSASKHGNIFNSQGQKWNYSSVPWEIGKDFKAPTCAVCHISLTINSDGEVINERTHQMSNRLGMRIFGLIYAHPQPKSPDTTIIRNTIGLPLPTDLDGKPSADYLISFEQVEIRREAMQKTCLACHSNSWVKNYFKRLDGNIAASNDAIRTATQQMQTIWHKGYARGLSNKGSIFDEYIERRWSDAWLLYANSIRFSSAMAGGGDYGVFENGRYHLSKTLMELQDWLDTREQLNK
ncbi:MAG: hydroxylamine oxidase [Desulfobacteraceae bacterium]|nr:hydroxylamine oxidase [Desulfobacteraceae bacterium]